MPQLNEDQIDCLGEFINVAYGKATARVADIMGAFATMRPPEIAVIDRDRFRELLLQACSTTTSCYLARQIFRGDVSGEVVFLLDERSAANITVYLKAQLGPDGGDDDDDVLLELSNIVTAAMMSELCAQMEAEVTLGEPEMHRLSILPESQGAANMAFDHVIKIETVIEFAEKQIHGRIFLLTHGHCFEWIRRTLDRVLNGLPG